MRNLSFFIVSILCHLAISRGFVHAGKLSAYMFDQRSLSAIVKGRPVDVILEERNKTGFFIKTYYVVLKIVHGFGPHRRIKVRTLKKFWVDNEDNIGMSIFRRLNRKDAEAEDILMPPGSPFIGDSVFGFWSVQNSGMQLWRFRRNYRHFPEVLGWGKFRPDMTFYDGIVAHRKDKRSFYGTNKEFGVGGAVTLENIPSPVGEEVVKNSLSGYFKKLIAIPRIKEKL